MQLTIYTDGGSLNNPGPAACSYIISKSSSIIIEKKSFFLGVQTNNIAEYFGVKNALVAVLRLKDGGLPISSLSFISDSLLLVNQLNGFYKVRDGKIRVFVFDIRSLEQQIGVPTKYSHVLREFNQQADNLVKELLLPHHS